MNTNKVLAVILMSNIFPAISHAWNSEEHQWLSQQSYSKACENIREAFEDYLAYHRLCSDYMSRYYGLATALAGDYFSKVSEFTNEQLFQLNLEQPCVHGSSGVTYPELEERYRKALDRFQLWQWWSYDATLYRKLYEFFDYGGLALNNGDHFMPNSRRKWRRLHNQSLDLINNDNQFVPTNPDTGNF